MAGNVSPRCGPGVAGCAGNEHTQYTSTHTPRPPLARPTHTPTRCRNLGAPKIESVKCFETTRSATSRNAFAAMSVTCADNDNRREKECLLTHDSTHTQNNLLVPQAPQSYFCNDRGPCRIRVGVRLNGGFGVLPMCTRNATSKRVCLPASGHIVESKSSEARTLLNRRRSNSPRTLPSEESDPVNTDRVLGNRVRNPREVCATTDIAHSSGASRGEPTESECISNTHLGRSILVVIFQQCYGQGMLRHVPLVHELKRRRAEPHLLKTPNDLRRNKK